ncbi:hypothetical protein EVAR_41355_1 [Eumeta japonica]|uniref:Uncharacterized protein n=1 Tax=Eumeta variegata TaxID=151549 RepID=A0A4C1XP77_EUMVA|nr:hypothetical protein EVAR_41355_1 [Eumeta japonica]
MKVRGGQRGGGSGKRRGREREKEILSRIKIGIGTAIRIKYKIKNKFLDFKESPKHLAIGVRLGLGHRSKLHGILAAERRVGV